MIIRILCLAVLLGISLTVRAQTIRANPDSALQQVLTKLGGTPLSVSEAVHHALDRSTAVKTAEAAYASAEGAARREAGVFDPAAYLNVQYQDDQAPTASFFSGATVLSTRQTSTTAGIRWQSPIGTTINASLSAIRILTNSSFAFLNPQITGLGTVSFRQPLLGGFQVSARKLARQTEQRQEEAKAQFDFAVLSVTSQVEQQYWDLYEAERNYAVQKVTRDQGEAFLREAELRAKAGLIGPSQVANARTFLAEQEVLLLDAEEQLDRLSDGMASLIGTRPDSNVARFITTEAPPEKFPESDLSLVVQEARMKNLGLQAARQEIEARRSLSDAAWWEALPTVNVVGSIGGNGLAGTPQSVIFLGDTLRTTVTGTAGEALRQALKRDFPTWTIGVEVNIPIGLRSGLGERERLDAEVAIAEQQYVEQTRVLEEQVRASWRDLFHGQRRLTAAREGVAAAQEQVRIGQIEFQNGRTTAFELVRLGADFAAAQQRYSQALVRSAKAAAMLRQLTSGAYPANAGSEKDSRTVE